MRTKLLLLLFSLSLCMGTISCVTVREHPRPPHKELSPGQHKKHKKKVKIKKKGKKPQPKDPYLILGLSNMEIEYGSKKLGNTLLSL